MENTVQKAKNRAARLFFVALAAAVGAGCAAVGPNYVKPEIPAPAKWSSQAPNGLAEGKLDSNRLASWWDALDDSVLSDLIHRAVSNNLDVKDAKSRIREARAERGIAKADFHPTIDGSGSYTRSRGSKDTGGGSVSNLYSTGLDSSWELDIFGGVRRSVEATQGDLEAVEEDLNDVLVTLASEVGLAYVDLRSYQAQLAVARKNLESQEETYKLTKWRSDAGLTTDLAVQQARYNMESTRSQIPALRTGMEESMNSIAVLLGVQPGSLRAELEADKPVPAPPREVAVGVPADVLRQRPDVRRAERELAAQTARVGVATADLYPKLTLSGSIGLDALTFGSLFSASSHSYSLGPSFSIPIFNAGALRLKVDVQTELQEQKLIAYEQSILDALKEVENALVAYSEEQNKRQALIEASDAARQAANLAEKQFSAGLTGFEDVLEAQRSLLTFESSLAESNGTVTSNLIRLYKALGGGWTPLAPAAENSAPSKSSPYSSSPSANG